jgi:hypothetical protein
MGKDAAFDFADAAPVDIGGISILFIAGDDTAFAADALFDAEVKAVLFAGAREAARREGDAIGGRNDRDEIRASENGEISG